MTSQIVPTGVTSSGMTISSGGDLVVSAGGVTVGTTILSGGTEAPSLGGLAESVTVSAGGRLIGAGQIGGTSVIYGLVNGATVVKSGLAGDDPYSMAVMSGGREVNVDLTSGAFEIISRGGVASGGLIQDQAVAFDYGSASGATLSNGNIFVQAGGSAFGDVIDNGGLEIIDWSGDACDGMAGGTATGETVLAGGELRVSSAGAAFGTVVQAGGTETDYAGGQTSGTILSGGVEYDYGHASATVIHAGGHEVLERGSIASGVVISNGGIETVPIGATTLATTVSVGGLLNVGLGVVSGGLTIEGGAVVISGAVGGNQTVDFDGSAGVLHLYNLPAFKAKISGLHSLQQKIDLGGFAYGSAETVSWTQSGTSGTLTVSDGTQTANLTLIGAYATGNFKLSTDGNGGTYVIDPPLPTAHGANRAAAAFTQAMAVFGGGEATAALVSTHPRDAAMPSAPALAPTGSSGR